MYYIVDMISILSLEHKYRVIIEYPYLGKRKDIIVLFTSPQTGVVVWCKNSKVHIGQTDIQWVESTFNYCDETVELSNS